ncbi:hypothetical protein [Rhodoferax sp.]|uniref:hypothetical protein n=1 Tax=Rhodoferax sp. TaxID=50421 RepID=UPI00283E0ABF|nr:hypothetical protein [Rhodoferax sp.]MDR3369659.1 hypothetical protein [Rhodoferax sp.]
MAGIIHQLASGCLYPMALVALLGDVLLEVDAGRMKHGLKALPKMAKFASKPNFWGLPAQNGHTHGTSLINAGEFIH